MIVVYKDNELNELIVNQLVLLYPDAESNKDKGDIIVSIRLMVVIDTSTDGLIVLQTEEGGTFFLHVPYSGSMIYIPKKDGEPICLKKNIFRKYQFPKRGQWV